MIMKKRQEVEPTALSAMTKNAMICNNNDGNINVVNIN